MAYQMTIASDDGVNADDSSSEEEQMPSFTSGREIRRRQKKLAQQLSRRRVRPLADGAVGAPVLAVDPLR